MVKTSAEMKWEWHANKHSLNEFTPLKLTYNKLLSTTEEFDEKVLNNTAIMLSFADVFIPEMNYTYTYDNAWGPDNLTWVASVKEGGNIFSGIWGLAGKKNGEKEGGGVSAEEHPGGPGFQLGGQPVEAVGPGGEAPGM